MRDQVEEDLDTFYEDIGVNDLTAGMDVEVGDVKIILFYQGQDLIGLVDGNTEFTFIVAGGDLEVAAGHDVWAQPDTDGIGMAEFAAEFFQVREAVDVDNDA